MIQPIQQSSGLQFARQKTVFQNFVQRVNAYDQAASPPKQQFKDGELGFFERYELAASKWGTRIAAGVALDHYAPLSKNNPFTQGLANKLKTVVPDLAEGRYDGSPHSYRSLLGIAHYRLDQINTLSGYKKVFFTQEGCTAWKGYVQENFRNFLISNSESSLTLGRSLKNTLFESDLRGIVRNIQHGQHWAGLAGCAGLGLLGWGVFSKTLDAYRYHHAKEDGLAWRKVKTAFFTAAHFVGQAVKSMACWELGTIGYILAVAALPVGGLLPLVAGILSGATLSTIGYKVLSMIIPEPPRGIV